MIDAKREIVPGTTAADIREIAEQIINRTDGNHPQLASENGFIDILQNGKPDISASPVFLKKVSL